MTKYKEILDRIRSDPAYEENLDWGRPRAGHPEGSIRKHIEELESNLDRLQSRLSSLEIEKLRVLIHTHDTFKANAKSGVAIADPQSHASLARQFLSKYVSDSELLNIVQFHDEPFAIWKKQRNGGDYTQRLTRLLEKIDDWNLFLAFLLVDGCTDGKSTEPLDWFLAVIHERVESRVDASWIKVVAHPENAS